MRRPSPVRSSSAGFTLIELMVALVISGIVAGVVFDLMLGQTRFARYQNAREEVQQNARAALEVISAELRGVPPTAIMLADLNRIQFRLPRAWGILCSPVTQATTTVWVRFPPDAFPADFPAASPTPNDWGLAVGRMTNAAVVPDTFTFVTGITNPGGASPCAANLQAPIGTGQWFERAVSGSGFVPAGWPNTVPVGTPVFVWQEVSYDLNTSNMPGIWIRRNSQPMAGPVPDDDGPNAGLQFAYFDRAGLQYIPPLVAEADVAPIARIQLQVISESRAKFNGTPQLQTASTEVYLRNRN